MREARTLVDALRARTPGYSSQLDPQRNVFGAEVHQAPSWGPDWLSPFAETSHPGGAQPTSYEWRHTIQEKPEDEMARLLYNHGNALALPPTHIGQIDLTQIRSTATGKTAYDRLQELTGTVEIGGKTLREQIEAVTQSHAYQHVLTDGDSMDAGSRVGFMQKWVGAYRSAAQQTLGVEQPEVAALIASEKMRKGRTLFQQP